MSDDHESQIKALAEDLAYHLANGLNWSDEEIARHLNSLDETGCVNVALGVEGLHITADAVRAVLEGRG